MIYTVKNMVVENSKLVYNDGVEKLFVYTRGTVGGSPKRKELLLFKDEASRMLANKFQLTEEDAKEYMKLYW